MRLRPSRNLIVLIVACCALLAFAPGPRVAFDVRSDRGHTLVTIAVAFVHFAFDIGHACPESNGCAGPRL